MGFSISGLVSCLRSLMQKAASDLLWGKINPNGLKLWLRLPQAQTLENKTRQATARHDMVTTSSEHQAGMSNTMSTMIHHKSYSEDFKGPQPYVNP